jgi:hypothetical protein
MTSPLDNLARPGGQLKKEAPDADEYAGLVRSGTAKAHDLRNLGEYEGDLNVDERLVKDLVTACKTVEQAVRKLSAVK